MKKIVAIVGSYRKGGINDQTVDAILDQARKNGAAVKKISLLETKIEFCTNCRACTKDDPLKPRGKCVIKDDLEKVLDEVDTADGIIMASPINDFTVTAIMKRFVERLIVYAYWPWEQGGPRIRVKEKNKKAVVVTSSACPGFIGYFMMPHARHLLTTICAWLGARPVKNLYFGMVNLEEHQKLNARQLAAARKAAESLTR